MPAFSVVPAEPLLPGGLADLSEEAESEGIRIVRTVTEQWADRTQRFDGPGEVILAATADDRVDGVVGIGALTPCPHLPGALRVRRFYVAPRWRRRGVAQALATEILDRGFACAGTITCNASASAAAAPFWESMGFVPANLAGITHVRHR